MSKHFERDLQQIQKQLLSLFGIVERMIDRAGQALCDRRVDCVAELIDDDRQVNEMEVTIEEECLKCLALHQPVAVDLRRLAAVIKVNADLERIADLACNIAERAQGLHEHDDFTVPDAIPEMFRMASEMVRLALDGFVDLDYDKARQVIKLDPVVDGMNRRIIDELKTMMKQDSSQVDPALHCFSAARHVERIADHAENIAEDVIYLVDGTIVRHKHGAFEKEKA